MLPETQQKPIYSLEYTYAAFGEDYYHVGYYDESKPLFVDRQMVSYQDFRQMKAQMETVTHRTIYTDAGSIVTYSVDEQMAVSQ